ncbi:MAG: SpoIIE family protein phosphatase [Deltaproteobacteria bacterium]|jgi:hypothetical protein|nr:SpoIIE family protein phosphatase [Deltaproteobacteria bacterium]
MFIDVHCAQLKKRGQNAFGDYFLSKRGVEEGRVIAVLSDGLGSGVKANILSCLTATMLLRFMDEHVDIKKAAETIMNSLPVCRIRKISYATFSALECDEDGAVRIVEEGNPDFIWMRGHEPLKSGYNVVASNSFPDRRLKEYNFKVEMGDRLVFCSDGVTQAGLGRPGRFNFGLRRAGLTELLKKKIKSEVDISSADLARFVVEEAESFEPEQKAQDDISACVVYFRTPRRALIFTGPPYDTSSDAHYARAFDSFSGRKAVCGGTTAKLLARELGRDLTVENHLPSGDLPPTANMKGVDLITDGALTLARTLEYLEKGLLGEADAAGRLTDFILRSDVLHFMVGAKLNQAHHDPRLPVELEIRRNLVNNIVRTLERKYLKKVTVKRI